MELENLFFYYLGNYKTIMVPIELPFFAEVVLDNLDCYLITDYPIEQLYSIIHFRQDKIFFRPKLFVPREKRINKPEKNYNYFIQTRIYGAILSRGDLETIFLKGYF